MSDTPETLPTQDPARINLGDPNEVRYWTRELDIGASTLWAIVNAVGPSPEAVRQHLRQAAN